jgi:hypothetical protein
MKICPLIFGMSHPLLRLTKLERQQNFDFE